MAMLTQRWNEYATRHGDQVWQPGRLAFLGDNDADIYAQMEGVRNGQPFEAKVLRFEGDGSKDRQTYFYVKARWLPDKSWIDVCFRTDAAQYASLTPTFVTLQLRVYAEPLELGSVFQTQAGLNVLADLSKLTRGTRVYAYRNDFVARCHRERPGGTLWICVPEWCVDPQQLDACIDLVTRMSNLSPACYIE